jgi:hypothetical protein
VQGVRGSAICEHGCSKYVCTRTVGVDKERPHGFCGSAVCAHGCSKYACSYGCGLRPMAVAYCLKRGLVELGGAGCLRSTKRPKASEGGPPAAAPAPTAAAPPPLDAVLAIGARFRVNKSKEDKMRARKAVFNRW